MLKLILAMALLGQLESKILVRETTRGIGDSSSVQYQIDTNNRWAIYQIGTDGFIERVAEGKLKKADAIHLKEEIAQLRLDQLPLTMGDVKAKVGPGHHCVLVQFGSTKRTAYCNNHPRLSGNLVDNVRESSHGYRDVNQMARAAQFADMVIEACTPIKK